MKNSAHWISTIRLWWTLGFSLLLLLNLDQFGTASGLGPAPKYWSVGVFGMTFLLFLPGMKPARLLRTPLLWWTLGYLLVSILWIGLADNLESAADGLVMVVTTCLYVGAALLAYPAIPNGSRLWISMLWVALLLAVLSIVQEYFNPAAYVFAEAGQGIQGRAAGLYLNPNTAAQTLVMLLACLMAHGTPRGNVIALLLSSIGLLLTFSRGGMLAWAVLAVAATLRGRLPRSFLLVIALAAGALAVAGPWVLDAVSTWVPPENRNSLDRLAWLLGLGDLNDFSAGEREYIAVYAWRQFLDAPFLGHGLGYMWSWTADVGTHNLTLRFMVEYGALGVLLFPLFLVASVRSAPRDAERAWKWLIAGIALMLTIFSHNMIEQATFLLPWLAICLMPREATKSRSGGVAP